MERSKALAALSALAHGDRLDLIRLLVPRGPEGLSAGHIARALGLSASRLSFHLNQMETAGLLHSRRVARHVFYAVDPAGLGQMIRYLLHDCCQAAPEVLDCCRQVVTPKEMSLPEDAALKGAAATELRISSGIAISAPAGQCPGRVKT